MARRTRPQRRQPARKVEPFLKGIHEMGMPEVVIDPNVKEEDGRWVFTFRHTVTQKMVLLKTHWLTLEESRAQFFIPRIYWNGSSSSEPAISDFLPEGWGYHIVFDSPDQATT